MVKNFTIEKDFTKYIEVFLEENSKLNLISKNDEKLLWEKHIYDSLAIKLTGKLKDDISILDIGCGGGFPSVPIAIEYPNIHVYGIDSIKKKINSINNIKNKLNLNNLITICDRVENIKDIKFDIITTRAVARLSKVIEYALPLLKKDGCFVAYKSRKSAEEIAEAENILKKYNAKIINIVEYTLPLDEVYERCLILIGYN